MLWINNSINKSIINNTGRMKRREIHKALKNIHPIINMAIKDPCLEVESKFTKYILHLKYTFLNIYINRAQNDDKDKNVLKTIEAIERVLYSYGSR